MYRIKDFSVVPVVAITRVVVSVFLGSAVLVQRRTDATPAAERIRLAAEQPNGRQGRSY